MVRIDLSRMMIEVLLRDLAKAWADLAAEQPTRVQTAKPDLWTAPDHAAVHAKARSGRKG